MRVLLSPEPAISTSPSSLAMQRQKTRVLRAVSSFALMLATSVEKETGSGSRLYTRLAKRAPHRTLGPIHEPKSMRMECSS